MNYHKLIATSLVCLSLVFGSIAYAQKAPAFILPGSDKQTINLEKLKGKVVYLDFWASWCDPCRKSFPWMNDMHDRYNGKDFTIIAVNLDSSKAEADKFLKKVPADFNIAYDPEGLVAEKYNLKAMPTSYLIDKTGKLVFAHKGYREGDADKIEQKIRQLLNKK